MIKIGIVTRSSVSFENHKINILYNEIVEAIYNNGGIPIGIVLNENYKEVLDMCDGIIFQGGDDFEEYDLKAIKYIYEINKPVFGICLGMQLMGVYLGGELIEVNNHKKQLSYCHQVKIKQTSKLYNIYKTNIIKVNSRHKFVLKNLKYNVCAISNDGYIEAIEDTNKIFFIGVQWHPESMLKYDKLQNNLFKYFVNSCKNI